MDEDPRVIDYSALNGLIEAVGETQAARAAKRSAVQTAEAALEAAENELKAAVISKARQRGQHKQKKAEDITPAMIRAREESAAAAQAARQELHDSDLAAGAAISKLENSALPYGREFARILNEDDEARS